MRWRQKINEDGTSEFIPIDASAKKASGGHFIHGDIESFVSPVDGSVISDRRQLDDHNKRNNVVNAGEFSPEFYAQKAKERADHHQGRSSKQETQARKEAIHEIIERQIRHGN